MQTILFVVSQSGARADGGAESVTQVIENLTEFRRVVLTQMETERNARWQRSGAEVILASKPHQWFGTWLRNITLNMECARLLRTQHIDLVHANDIQGLLGSIVAARNAGKRVVFNVRNILEPARTYGLHWRIAHSMCHRIVVLSREMQQELGSRLMPLPFCEGAQIDYIYSSAGHYQPLRNEERAAVRSSLGINPCAFAVGYVASVTPRKRQLCFLKSVVTPLLRQSHAPPTQWHFLGDANVGAEDYLLACKDYIFENQFGDRVQFHGHQSNVNDWYRAWDVTAIASVREGLARCMIESLACGTPVVSFDVCSAREILEGHECGIVVPAGDYNAFLDAVRTLINRPDLLSRYADNARTTAAELFDPEQTFGRYRELYNSLCDKK